MENISIKGPIWRTAKLSREISLELHRLGISEEIRFGSSGLNYSSRIAVVRRYGDIFCKGYDAQKVLDFLCGLELADPPSVLQGINSFTVSDRRPKGCAERGMVAK
jgi:hypothetical protein